MATVMQDLICEAYTVIEFSALFENYIKDDYVKSDGLPESEMYLNWIKCMEAYNIVSKYMSNESLIQAHNLVIHEL